MTIIGLVLCGLGTLTTCVNFYLNFLRYPVHCWRGGTIENYRWISGIPVFGSLLLWVSAGLLLSKPTLMWAAIIISLFDTAGLHWCAGTLVYMSLFGAKDR